MISLNLDAHVLYSKIEASIGLYFCDLGPGMAPAECILPPPGPFVFGADPRVRYEILCRRSSDQYQQLRPICSSWRIVLSIRPWPAETLVRDSRKLGSQGSQQLYAYHPLRCAESARRLEMRAAKRQSHGLDLPSDRWQNLVRYPLQYAAIGAALPESHLK